MSKYMLSASYTQAGTDLLLAEGGSNRREALAGAIESVGGSLESFYYAFGDTDLFMIAEIPDDTTATALSMRINAAGVLIVSVTKLIEVEKVDHAIAKQVTYRTEDS